jgi:hypothetical protein
MHSLHAHHPVWPMAAPLLNSQHVPIYLGVPPFHALVSFGNLYSCTLLFSSLHVVYSPIDLSLPLARPSNHGLLVEVKLPVIFPHHGTYDHDDSVTIPVRSLAPARLISYWETPHTWSLAWWIDIGPCQSLFPCIIHCMLFVIDTFPRAFPTNLTIDTTLLSYPHLLYNLIIHCDWWSSVGQSYPAWVLRAFRWAFHYPPQCDLPGLSYYHNLLSLVGCSLF